MLNLKKKIDIVKKNNYYLEVENSKKIFDFLLEKKKLKKKISKFWLRDLINFLHCFYNQKHFLVRTIKKVWRSKYLSFGLNMFFITPKKFKSKRAYNFCLNNKKTTYVSLKLKRNFRNRFKRKNFLIKFKKKVGTISVNFFLTKGKLKKNL